MDLRTGEIREEEKMTLEQLKHSLEILQADMTEKQKREKKVSLKDHKSKLGKLLTKQRKLKGYSQMSINQKRNIRNKLRKKSK
jgi:hypothetical protein